MPRAGRVTGRSGGGLSSPPPQNRVSREEALRLWTEANTWFSSETGKKGQIAPGQLADLAVLDRDYFSVPEDEIQDIESIMTILGGEVVYATDEYSSLAPPPVPVLPDWSPVATFGGYQKRPDTRAERSAAASCGCASTCAVHGHNHAAAWASAAPVSDQKSFWGALGCLCWAV